MLRPVEDERRPLSFSPPGGDERRPRRLSSITVPGANSAADPRLVSEIPKNGLAYAPKDRYNVRRNA